MSKYDKLKEYQIELQQIIRRIDDNIYLTVSTSKENIKLKNNYLMKRKKLINRYNELKNKIENFENSLIEIDISPIGIENEYFG